MQIEMNGKHYEVVHTSNPNRLIINYDGLFVFVEKQPDGTWDLSGEPGNPEERQVLKKLTESMNDVNVTRVIPPGKE